MKTLQLVVFSISLLIIGEGIAQMPIGRVDRPTVKVGDSWTYREVDLISNVEQRRSRQEVEKVTHSEIAIKETDEATGAMTVRLYTNEWNPIVWNGRYTPFFPAYSFPLEDGKEWRGECDVARPDASFGQRSTEGKVVGQEQITVPAGTFTAIKISLFSTFRVQMTGANSTGTIKEEVWYVPAIKRSVKGTIESYVRVMGTTYRSGYELVSYDFK